jgi:hypothetical protein
MIQFLLFMYVASVIKNDCIPNPLLKNGKACIYGFQCASKYCSPSYKYCMADADTPEHNYTLEGQNPTYINNVLLKNQHRPMRKGISNMIRLHATGAIAMPTELRLHILASSKDIIHS